jgi:prophage DNA circulation protein
VEDNGRAARPIRFDCFVVGPDYVQKAKALLDALEAPGPGALVHPWFGTVTVSIDNPASYTFNNELGKVTFQLSFIESGELTFPSAVNSTPTQSRLAASSLEAAAASDFAQAFKVDGFPDFVEADASRALTMAFGQVSSGTVPGLGALEYATAATGYLETGLAMMRDPASLAQTVVDFLGISGYATSSLQWGQLAQSLVRLAQLAGLMEPAAPAVYTSARYQSYVNARATNALTRQVLLAQAVGASSLVTPTVYDETVQLRDALAAALDAESLKAGDAGYEALQTARGKVWRDLTERSRDGARLTTRTPLDTMPAVVLAYDLYEAADREGEICARNAVRHPGFVPPSPLKVLTR